MKTTKWAIAMVAATLLGAGAMAGADPGEEGKARREDRRPPRGGPPAPEEIFKLIDTDGDGAITQEEFAKHHQERMGKRRNGPPGDREGFGPPRGRRGKGDRDGRGFGPPPRDGERLGPPQEGDRGPRRDFRRRDGDRGQREPGMRDRGMRDRGPRERGMRDRGPHERGPQDRGPRGPRFGEAGPPACPHCQGTGVMPPPPRDGERPAPPERRDRPEEEAAE